MQSHLEAPSLERRLRARGERPLGLPPGTIKATVLIETLPAAFEMDEILWELRDHAAGLNCGRWDYIFSFIKVHRNDPGAVLPDRSQITMDQGVPAGVRAAARSRRAIAAARMRMGGMAAQIPIKDDPAANDAALAKVVADKRREVNDGHDGTWVAHPGLVPVAARRVRRRRCRDRISSPGCARTSPSASATCSRCRNGTRTEAGLRWNLRVGVQYLEAWLRGVGCVPLYNLMEDAATAEISRTQIWQWLRHGATLDDGRAVDAALVRVHLLTSEMAAVRAELGTGPLRRRPIRGRDRACSSA